MISTDDCWLYTGMYGSFGGRGHGQVYVKYANGRTFMTQAHVAMYESVFGPVPEGLELDHLCENPPCINPAHLEPVTHQVNTLRYYRNRTHCRKGHPYSGGVSWAKKKSNISKANPTGLTRNCMVCHKMGQNRWLYRSQASPEPAQKEDIEL